MVGVARLELTTPRSQSECATNCATPRLNAQYFNSFYPFCNQKVRFLQKKWRLHVQIGKPQMRSSSGGSVSSVCSISIFASGSELIGVARRAFFGAEEDSLLSDSRGRIS